MSAGASSHGFRRFGTDVRVIVDATRGFDALRVHALFDRLHRTLTRFAPDSELSVLNARSGRETACSPLLVEAVQAALSAARLSGGLVDPTLLDALERAGYAGSREGVACAPLVDALRGAPALRAARPRRPGPWTEIAVDRARGTVRLPAGVRLDLGGTAKGWAADLAAGLLAAHARYAVDVGGDIRIGGRDPAPRPVRIEDPVTGEVAHTFEITTGAVATSGLRSRIWRTETGFAHHLIDPSSGAPAWTGVIQATALAPTGLEAETLAKTALLSGPSAGARVLARHGGALILDDGRLERCGRLAEAGAVA